MKCTLERLSKKVKFALIDRRNATREQVPIGHFTICLLICTLISENQGLEKLRSVSNLGKNSGPADLDFFQVYGINLAFFRWTPRKKKSRFAGPEIFLRFETDLDFSRP